MATKKLSKKILKGENADRPEGHGVSFEFTNGATTSATLDQFPLAILFRLAVHGLSQKGGDAIVSQETIEGAFEATKRVLDGLLSGEWSTRIEGAGGPKIGLLVEALSRVTGRTIEECASVISELQTKDEALEEETGEAGNQIKTLRKVPKIDAAIKAIRAERATAAAAAATASSAEVETNLEAMFG